MAKGRRRRHKAERDLPALAADPGSTPRWFDLLPLAPCPLPSVLGGCRSRGLTAAATVASAYDTVLNADFDRLPAVLDRTCGPAPPVACLGLRALATWWEILLDPQSRFLDARFLREVDAAVDARHRVDDARARAGRGLVLSRRRARRARTVARAARGTPLGRARRQAHQGGPRARARARSGHARCGVRHRRLPLLRRHRARLPAVAALAVAAAGRQSRRAAWRRWSEASRDGAAGAGRGTVPAPHRLSVVRAAATWKRWRWCAGCRQRYPRNPLFRQIEAEILDVLRARQRRQPRGLRGRCSTMPSTARSNRAGARRGAGAPEHRGAAGSPRAARSRARARSTALLAAGPARPAPTPWHARGRCSARGRRGSDATESGALAPTTPDMEGKPA